MILCICGLPGAGKSTVAEKISRRIGADLVAWDSYETMTHRTPDEVADWLYRGAPFSEISAPGLPEKLRRSSGPIVLDSPLGPAWPPVGLLSSGAVWLDCPPDIALARKIEQMLPLAGPQWIDSYLKAYPRIVAPALSLQRERVPGQCSQIIDATKPVDSIVNAILRHFFSNV